MPICPSLSPWPFLTILGKHHCKFSRPLTDTSRASFCLVCTWKITFVDVCIYGWFCFFFPVYPFPKAEPSHASFVWWQILCYPLHLPVTGSVLDLGVQISHCSARLPCVLHSSAQAQGLRWRVISYSPLLSSPGLSYQICYICIG